MKYTKKVDGLSWDMRFMRMTRQKLNVQITSDKLGKTLSIDDGKTLLSIPLEQIDVLKMEGYKK